MLDRVRVVGAAVLLSAGCGPTIAPDIYGTVSLAPGVTVDPTTTLVISAGPITRATEFLDMEVLQLPAAQARFPLPFLLRGENGPASNLWWEASARLSHEPTSIYSAPGDLEGSVDFNFECREEEPFRRCLDAEVEIVIGVAD